MRMGPIATGLGAGLVALALLAWPLASSLGRLGEARTARAEAGAHAALPDRAPSSLVSAGLALSGGDPGPATTALATRIRTLAANGGVLVEEMAPVAAPPGLVALRLRLSGGEKAVVALADTLEREAPLVRLSNWRMEALAGSGVRLQAQAIGAWR